MSSEKVENRICQNCKQDFTIEAEDFDFYKKMNVPPPSWCPECRMVRRFSAMNVWELYKRPCAKCGKSVISIYSPKSPLKVYCMECWWADDWDGTEYGRDYDPSRPFLEQLIELAKTTPYSALESAYLTMVNSDYCSYAGHLKNCYLCFWADYCENALYSTFLNGLRDSLDCYRIKESELLYECIGMHKSYRCSFSEECDSCTDLNFSRSCFGCSNCVGCINLRNQSYCIFNQKYSKEDYKRELASFNLNTRAGIKTMLEKVDSFWLKHPRRAYIGNPLNLNVTGEYVYESKNTKNAYMVAGAENCKYVQFISVAPAYDCFDYSGWGNSAERIYESTVVGEGAADIKFSFECWPDALQDEYCYYAIAGKYNFGCANLKRKQYAILNKVYPKDEYEKIKAQIITDMERNPYIDKQGRVWKYGEFLPIDMYAFAYNESVAHRFFPKNKTQAGSLGYRWIEEPKPEYKITKQANDLPEKISEVSDEITKEIIGCAGCGRGYRIVDAELMLYKKLNVPLPHKCPNCRFERRFNRCAKPVFYNRTCAKCGTPIRTSYSPDRPEIVYCEKCYQSEVV